MGYSEPGLRAATGPAALSDLLKRYRPDLLPPETSPRAVYQILQQEFGNFILFNFGGISFRYNLFIIQSS